MSLRSSLSDERLGAYLVSCNGDFPAAIALYEDNTRWSGTFYTPLHCVEICLRNKINAAMTARYGADWLVNAAPPLHEDAITGIAHAKRSLRGQDSPGAIIAELNFGFWVGLLAPRYDSSLWREALFRIFFENGRRLKRERAHSRFNAIRRFRNRVAHHEPIIFRDLPLAHEEMIEALSWMCGVTADWALRQSRAPQSKR